MCRDVEFQAFYKEEHMNSGTLFQWKSSIYVFYETQGAREATYSKQSFVYARES